MKINEACFPQTPREHLEHIEAISQDIIHLGNVEIEFENQSYCLRVNSVDRQRFLDFGAALFNFDQAIAVLAEFAQVEFLPEGIAEEPAIAVNRNHIERMLA